MSSNFTHMYRLRLLIVIIILFLCEFLWSDTVYLNNGKIIQGKIIKQSRTKIQIELENKRTLILEKKDIKKIIFGKSPLIEKDKKEDEQKKLEEEKKNN
ncbi:MAG: hypothetical protein KatS3mg129_2000 [Leptospiraceae bacterium]|nr:MAG: hypothetical protein KatS3mg129_2000 [Leptospiraceae bacterium]